MDLEIKVDEMHIMSDKLCGRNWLDNLFHLLSSRVQRSTSQHLQKFIAFS